MQDKHAIVQARKFDVNINGKIIVEKDDKNLD